MKEVVLLGYYIGRGEGGRGYGSDRNGEDIHHLLDLIPPKNLNSARPRKYNNPAAAAGAVLDIDLAAPPSNSPAPSYLYQLTFLPPLLEPPNLRDSPC